MVVRHAFADESVRGQRYYVCAAVVAAGDVAQVRQLARSLCTPGQRRLHFVKERDSRRGQILGAIVSSGLVRAWVGEGKGNQSAVRLRCLRQLGPDLVELGAERLVIESREGQDVQDRRALHAALPAPSRLTYEHMPPAAEPGLWLADAVAWCYSAGGTWRQRVEPIVAQVRDVGRA